MPEPSVSSRAIYQLRAALCGVSPLVWRRLLLASDTSLAEPVGDQSSGEQTDGEKTTDGLEPARGTPAATDTNPGAR
jgi:hypothetical protein